MLPAFLATILFSLSAVSATRSLRYMAGTEANFWRLVLATAFLGLYAHGRGSGLGGGAFHIFLISGFIGFGLGDVALYQALPRLGSRLTILLVHCLATPIAVVTEWLWLETTLSGAEMISSFTILCGVALALAPGENPHLARPALVAGILFAAVAAGGQGFGAVLSRRAFQVSAAAGQSVDGLSAAYQRIIGGVLVAGVFALMASWRGGGILAEGGPVRESKRRAAPWILFNAVAGPALGVGCFQWALKTTPTGIVLPIVAITPLVIIPFARHMEGDRPSGRALLGGLIAVAGAVALSVVAQRAG